MLYPGPSRRRGGLGLRRIRPHARKITRSWRGGSPAVGAADRRIGGAGWVLVAELVCGHRTEAISRSRRWVLGSVTTNAQGMTVRPGPDPNAAAQAGEETAAEYR